MRVRFAGEYERGSGVDPEERVELSRYASRSIHFGKIKNARQSIKAFSQHSFILVDPQWAKSRKTRRSMRLEEMHRYFIKITTRTTSYYLILPQC